MDHQGEEVGALVVMEAVVLHSSQFGLISKMMPMCFHIT